MKEPLIVELNTLMERFEFELIESKADVDREEPENFNISELVEGIGFLKRLLPLLSDVRDIRMRHDMDTWNNMKLFNVRGLEEQKLLAKAHRRLREAWHSRERPVVLRKVPDEAVTKSDVPEENSV